MVGQAQALRSSAEGAPGQEAGTGGQDLLYLHCLPLPPTPDGCCLPLPPPPLGVRGPRLRCVRKGWAQRGAQGVRGAGGPLHWERSGAGVAPLQMAWPRCGPRDGSHEPPFLSPSELLRGRQMCQDVQGPPGPGTCCSPPLARPHLTS